MIEFDAFRYDPESRILYRDDEEILLPPRVLAVLESLLKRPGKVVPKEDLLASAWDGAFVGEDSLTQAISQLRQVLNDEPQSPTYIQTIPRRGYRFIAEVSRPLESPGAASEPGRLEAPEASSDPDAPTSADVPVGDVVPLQPGSRLGRYEVVDRVGTGAMGEVWRAHDHELDREVALKLVPPDLATDPKAMERFRREARMLAAVDHPNVAGIHTVEEANGTRFIVMELVEGKSLQDVLGEGALSIDKTLQYALQIAKGLEVAHERGIVHRDLKPGNVAVTDDGQVKLLDFGLAKEVQRGDRDAISDPTSLTKTGTLLGTAPYMSPEQARGDDVDERTDIWAFGCLLYEMLAGERAFDAGSQSDTLAAILTREPDWTPLPSETPPSLRVLLRRCLQKEPSRRLHHIADARLEIEDLLEGADFRLSAETAPGAAPDRQAAGFRSMWLSPGPLVLALAIALIVAAWGWLRSSPTGPGGAARFAVELDPGWRLTAGDSGEELSRSYLERVAALQRPALTAVAWSPDGRHLVYAATDEDESRLFLRPMGRLDAMPITGTEGGGSPFFSPDGEWIGFVAGRIPVTLSAPAGGSLMKVRRSGGEPRTILENVGHAYGVHWGDDDTIVLAAERTGYGIVRVAAAGGEPAPLTTVATEEGESGHSFPHLLPDGRGVIFTVRTETGRDDIAVRRIGADGHDVLVENGSDARFLRSGHLVFVREGTLMAVPFDAERLQLIGDPVRVLEDVAHARFGNNPETDSGAGQFSISGSGSLAYATGGVTPEPDFPLAWVNPVNPDRTPERIRTPVGAHTYPRLPPDGDRIAYNSGRFGEKDIWIHDLRSDTSIRLTHGHDTAAPVWSPDGTRIAFASSLHGGAPNLYVIAADGSGEPQRLTVSEQSQFPSSWSVDGVIAFRQGNEPSGYDIWILPMDDGTAGHPQPFLAGPERVSHPAFSPDGNWLAYTSNATDEIQVYVTAYPGPAPPIQVSRQRGVAPMWSRDCDWIFYRVWTPRPPKIMAVDIDYADGLTVGTPRLAFEGPMGGTGGSRNHDVAADGRFLVSLEIQQEPLPLTELRVVLDWFNELEELVPAGR